MSASLVGSEMCIRDSSARKAVQNEPQTSAGEVFVAMFALGANNGAEWAPVSYTHLTLPTICSV
eukprot:548701-Alexandrium_andersonii.AAC.1